MNHKYFENCHDKEDETFPETKLDFSFEDDVYEKDEEGIKHIRKLMLNEYFYYNNPKKYSLDIRETEKTENIQVNQKSCCEII